MIWAGSATGSLFFVPYVCSALRKEDDKFAPAYLLADSRLERAGRLNVRIQYLLFSAVVP